MYYLINGTLINLKKITYIKSYPGELTVYFENGTETSIYFEDAALRDYALNEMYTKISFKPLYGGNGCSTVGYIDNQLGGRG